jgi:ABC-type arginine/histidine transport system permease subunit
MGLRGACLAFVIAELAVAASAYKMSPPPVKEVWGHPLIYVVLASAAVMGAVLEVGSRHLSPVTATILAGAVYLVMCGLLARRRILEEFRTAQ